MICPNCQINAVISEQLYGALYTCGGCQAVYFINFEGQPEFGEVPSGILSDIISEPSSLEPVASEPFVKELAAPESVNATSEDSLVSVQETETFESSLEPLVDSVDMVSFDNKLDDQFNAQINDQNLQTDMPENQNIEPTTDFSNTELNPFEQQQPEVNAEIQNPSSFTNIAKEISDFGNAEVQLSGLNYDLNITGLDSQETMRLFKEAIEDSKFGWNANELLSTVKNGQIKFERLSPVKAYILAKRLQFLDIEKHWKQNAMS